MKEKIDGERRKIHLPFHRDVEEKMEKNITMDD